MAVVWTPGAIHTTEMLCDSSGHRVLNGKCYKVEVSSDDRSCLVEVVITAVAVGAAMHQSVDDAGMFSLVRAYIEVELDRGWDPVHYPWLTIDSDNVSQLLCEVKTAVAH